MWSGLIGSDPLFGAVLPMSFTLTIAKLPIQPLRASNARTGAFLEPKVTWMFVRGRACSGLKAPSFALNLCRSLLILKIPKGMSFACLGFHFLLLLCRGAAAKKVNFEQKEKASKCGREVSPAYSSGALLDWVSLLPWR